MAGQKVPARDGPTWAEQFARFPNLRALVRDDGTGLGKGLKLDDDRRREAGEPQVEQTLDVFHTLGEGVRALRKTWSRATAALEDAEAAQRRHDRRVRQGPSCQGHGTSTRRPWVVAERLCDQATAAESAWNRAQSAVEFFTPSGRLHNPTPAEAVIATV